MDFKKIGNKLLRQRNIIIFSLAFPVIIALIITISMRIPLSLIEVSNDWIGFYGSYAGSIIGGIIALIIMSKTNETNKKISEEATKSEFCNSISELIGQFCVHASECYYTNRHNKDSDYFRENKIKLKSIRYTIEIRLNQNENAENLLTLITTLDEHVSWDRYCKGESDDNLNSDIQDIIKEAKQFINKYKEL